MTQGRIAAGMLVVATLGSASVASANVNDVSLRIVRLDAAEACAVDVEVRNAEMDLFNGAEELQFGATTVGTFAPLTEERTTITAGTHVLFASSQFVSAAGGEIVADVALTGADCALLVPGVTVRFIGSFGDEAATLTLPATVAAMFAFDELGLTDLEVAAILLYNAAGTPYTIGEGEPLPPPGGGGGCAVAGGRAGDAAVIALAIAALALGAGRRTRRRGERQKPRVPPA